MTYRYKCKTIIYKLYVKTQRDFDSVRKVVDEVLGQCECKHNVKLTHLPITVL